MPKSGDPGATPMAAPASPMAVSDVLRDARSRVNRSTERFAGEESNRERMRRIFTNVPVIYGFSSKAPIGETAAGMLNRYLRNGGAREFGSGRVSGNLLSSFRGTSMTATSGMRETDRDAGYREQVCRFFDERVPPAKKLDFVHQILERNNNDVRRFLDRIEKFTTSLALPQRSEPAFAQTLDEISRDDASRTRYLALMRAERPAVRARMIRLASTFGWVTSEGERNETVAMVRDVLARPRLDAADAEFVCALNDDHDLDEETGRFTLSAAQAEDAGHRAALACLGDRDSHAWMPRALTSAKADDAKIAPGLLPASSARQRERPSRGLGRRRTNGRFRSEADRPRHARSPLHRRCAEPGRARAAVFAVGVGGSPARGRGDPDPVRLSLSGEGRPGAHAGRPAGAFGRGRGRDRRADPAPVVVT